MAATEGLPGAGQADGNTQNSTIMGSLREKGGQRPSVLLSYNYYLNYKLGTCILSCPQGLVSLSATCM